MNINNIIAALKARCPSFGASAETRRFAGSAEFSALAESTKLDLPAGYVIPLNDEVYEQASSNGYKQEIKERFSVVVVISNTLDERGQTSILAIDGIRAELFRAVLGWSPDENHDRIEYEGGALLEMDRARIYYEFEFSSMTELNEEDTYQYVYNQALPMMEQVGIRLDAIDPFDPNLVTIGPDGRIEVNADIDIPQT